MNSMTTGLLYGYVNKKCFFRNGGIMKFREHYGFLSNMYPCKVRMTMLNGGTYVFDNAEAAFQASKFAETEKIERFIGLEGRKAKRLGKTIRLNSSELTAWNSRRNAVMKQVVSAKFNQNPELAKQLEEVSEPIVEENTWNDTYWGVCRGKGQNHLGLILQEVQKEITEGGK